MRFLVVGLGSMGRRRIRNLQANGEKEIVGWDSNPERRREAEEKYGVKTIEDISEVPKIGAAALIISTPPNQHGDYIRLALAHKKHFFVEVTTSEDGYEDVLRDHHPSLVKAPSCTYRFFTPVKMLKKHLEDGAIGRVLAFQYHMGQYLPDWHPWEDYRKVYFAQKETGACREMLPFELIWLNWLINSMPIEIRGYAEKVSDLEMEAEDVIAGSLKYKNGVLGNIMVDVISREPFRTLRFLGTEGVVTWEWLKHQITIYRAGRKSPEILEVPKGNPETGYLNAEEMYQEEIKTYLDAVYGRRKYPYSFAEDLQNLRIMKSLLNVT